MNLSRIANNEFIPIFDMMRSTLLIFLTFFYLATSSGISVNIHFCTSRISGIEFFAKAKCCCDGVNTKKSCCEDHKTFIKIKDEHNASKLEIGNVNYFKLLVTPFMQGNIDIVQPSFTKYYIKNMDGPPIHFSSELNILQGVFRI